MGNGKETPPLVCEGAARRSRRITASIGIFLVLAGIVCNPAGYYVLNGGAHSIGSSVYRMLAWGAGAGMVGAGTLLFLFRRVVSPANLLLLGGMCVFCLVFMEAALAALGINSPYSFRVKVPPLVPWFTYSQETGSRFIPEKFVNPAWPINSDGFPGMEEFTANACSTADARILVIGDSFTYGVAASDYRLGYISLMEQRICEKRNALVWNTGIPGIGQKQEFYSLKTYGPLLRPQLVVLGFCKNDLNDNMYPMSAHYVFENSPYIFRYELSPDGSVRTLSPREAFLRAHPLSERLSASRVIYKACGLVRGLQLWLDTRDARAAARSTPRSDDGIPPEELMKLWGAVDTRRIFRRIRDFVEVDNARLLVVLIPYPKDLDAPTPVYQAMLHICKSLEIEYIDVRHLLTRADYVLEPDVHWNDAGHAKVAEALTARVEAILNETVPAARAE